MAAFSLLVSVPPGALWRAVILTGLLGVIPAPSEVFVALIGSRIARLEMLVSSSLPNHTILVVIVVDVLALRATFIIPIF